MDEQIPTSQKPAAKADIAHACLLGRSWKEYLLSVLRAKRISFAASRDLLASYSLVVSGADVLSPLYFAYGCCLFRGAKRLCQGCGGSNTRALYFVLRSNTSTCCWYQYATKMTAC
jgi:hypothetical protein